MARKPTDPPPEKPKLRLVSPDAKKPPEMGGSAPRTRIGRPPFEPTKDQRNLVCLCAAMGYTQEQTAFTLGIDVKTLCIHFKDELENGAMKVNGVVAGNLFKIASSATHPRAVTAAIFWMKSRAGWKDGSEKQKVEPGDGDDEDEEITFSVSIGDKGGA